LRGGERRERGRGRGGREEGEGGERGEEKGRDPKGWLTSPMFQILENTLISTIQIPGGKE